jgi:hypothetical protein
MTMMTPLRILILTDERSVDDAMPENRSEGSEEADDMPPLMERTRTACEMHEIEIDGKNPITDVNSSTGPTTWSSTKGTAFAQTTQRPLVINPITWEHQFGETLGICFTQYTMK